MEAGQEAGIKLTWQLLVHVPVCCCWLCVLTAIVKGCGIII